MTIWHMRIACWIPKSTNTYSDYVILIVFSIATMVYESPSLLYYYVACLVNCVFVFKGLKQDKYVTSTYVCVHA